MKKSEIQHPTSHIRHPAPPAICAAIRAARLSAGLTQQDLADRCGIPRDRLSVLERRIVPTVATLHRIAAALGRSLILDCRGGARFD